MLDEDTPLFGPGGWFANDNNKGEKDDNGEDKKNENKNSKDERYVNMTSNSNDKEEHTKNEKKIRKNRERYAQSWSYVVSERAWRCKIE
jgi:hypothetical protein